MSEASVTDAGPPPQRGWYADPTMPGRDRWWNGYVWTDQTARTPRPSMFGPGYERAMRARPNRLAFISQWFAVAAFTLFFVVLFVGYIAEGPSVIRLLTIIWIPQWLLSVAAIALGILGARGSRRWGGLAPAIYSIVLGAIAATPPTLAAIVILTPLSG